MMVMMIDEDDDGADKDGDDDDDDDDDDPCSDQAEGNQDDLVWLMMADCKLMAIFVLSIGFGRNVALFSSLVWA